MRSPRWTNRTQAVYRLLVSGASSAATTRRARSTSPAQSPRSIWTSSPMRGWPRCASRDSPGARAQARAARQGSTDGRSRSCRSLPERHYDLAGGLLAQAVERATAEGVGVKPPCTRRHSRLDARSEPPHAHRPVRGRGGDSSRRPGVCAAGPRLRTAPGGRRDRAGQLPVPRAGRPPPHARVRHEPGPARWAGRRHRRRRAPRRASHPAGRPVLRPPGRGVTPPHDIRRHEPAARAWRRHPRTDDTQDRVIAATPLSRPSLWGLLMA